MTQQRKDLIGRTVSQVVSAVVGGLLVIIATKAGAFFVDTPSRAEVQQLAREVQELRIWRAEVNARLDEILSIVRKQERRP